MLGILGWIVWAFSAFIALSLTYGAVRKLKSGNSVMKATLYQGIFLWIVLAFFLLNQSISKIHLIWIVIISFPVIGFFVTSRAKANNN